MSIESKELLVNELEHDGNHLMKPTILHGNAKIFDLVATCDDYISAKEAHINYERLINEMKWRPAVDNDKTSRRRN